jgi:hypothetical protein
MQDHDRNRAIDQGRDSRGVFASKYRPGGPCRSVGQDEPVAGGRDAVELLGAHRPDNLRQADRAGETGCEPSDQLRTTVSPLFALECDAGPSSSRRHSGRLPCGGAERPGNVLTGERRPRPAPLYPRPGKYAASLAKIGGGTGHRAARTASAMPRRGAEAIRQVRQVALVVDACPAVRSSCWMRRGRCGPQSPNVVGSSRRAPYRGRALCGCESLRAVVGEELDPGVA